MVGCGNACKCCSWTYVADVVAQAVAALLLLKCRSGRIRDVVQVHSALSALHLHWLGQVGADWLSAVQQQQQQQY